MAGKFDKTMIIVSAIVGSLGALSAILGFSAEGTKLTITDILVIGDDCYYPPNPAFALGICASIFLVMAQITVAAVSGCCGCCKSRAFPSETKRIVGVVCAVASWISAVVAWVLFIDEAAANENRARATAPVCYVPKDGVFAGAAVLTLVTTALGITSYAMLRGKPDAPKPADQQPAAGAGIAMGQPQFPAPPHGYGQAPNYPQYPPPPLPQGYGIPAPNNYQFPPTAPPPAQSDGLPSPHQQYAPPPAQVYGLHALNQQFPHPAPEGHEPV